MPYAIKLKRVYEEASDDDGPRILVERLWPRGVAKGEARIDLWIKDVAPSTGLRKWFGHDPEKWPLFRRQYWEELRGSGAALGELRQKLEAGTVTLIYSSHDREHNSAVALKEFLEQ